MANASEKAAVKRYESTRSLYMKIILALTGLYALIRIIIFGSSFGSWNWAGFVLLSAVNAICYKIVMMFLLEGNTRDSYALVEELMWVNWFVQGTSIISDWFWLVYLSVPAYAFYRYGLSCIAKFQEEREAAAAMDAQANAATAGKEKKKSSIKYRNAY